MSFISVFLEPMENKMQLCSKVMVLTVGNITFEQSCILFSIGSRKAGLTVLCFLGSSAVAKY